MRISDWSSDVCSSDLRPPFRKRTMNEVEKAKKEGRGYYTSTRDTNLNHNQRGVNVRAAQLAVGVAGELTAHIMAVIDVQPGPGDTWRGTHPPCGNAINLIVTRSVWSGGTWLAQHP